MFDNHNMKTITRNKNNYRMTHEYKKWREWVMCRDKFSCRACDTMSEVLHVHHIKPYATHKHLRSAKSNGVTLCCHCHKLIHKAMKQWAASSIKRNTLRFIGDGYKYERECRVEGSKRLKGERLVWLHEQTKGTLERGRREGS